jgi:hypothetical protein
MISMAESDKSKANVILTAAKEVSFSCADMSNLMNSITSASARADVFKQVIMSSISDRSNVSLLEQRLNPRDLDSIIKHMGILYFFDPHHPTGHYLLDLSEQTHFDLASQLMIINASLRNARRSSNGYPDLSQSNNFMCSYPSPLPMPYSWTSVPWFPVSRCVIVVSAGTSAIAASMATLLSSRVSGDCPRKV